MDVFEAIRTRRSIRAYTSTPVPEEELNKILEAASLAPSAENIQPWYFIVVTDQEKRKQIAESGFFAGFIEEAPILIVGCGDRKASPRWYEIDVAIAMQNMVLAATAQGLGTCWVGSFDEELVRKLLKIPEHFEIIALLTVGYPRKMIGVTGKVVKIVRRRKELSKIVGYEEFKGRKAKQ